MVAVLRPEDLSLSKTEYEKVDEIKLRNQCYGSVNEGDESMVILRVNKAG